MKRAVPEVNGRRMRPRKEGPEAIVRRRLARRVRSVRVSGRYRMMVKNEDLGCDVEEEIMEILWC